MVTRLWIEPADVGSARAKVGMDRESAITTRPRGLASRHVFDDQKDFAATHRCSGKNQLKLKPFPRDTSALLGQPQVVTS